MGPVMEVTVSGVSRQRRAALQQLVEALRGRYSGSLVVGRTSVVVVETGVPVDWAAPKLAAAVAQNIAVVCASWLADSEANGFLLCPASYVVRPQGQGRRSSAASVSQAPAPPGRPKSAGAAFAGSPELEKLRCEAVRDVQGPYAPFVDQAADAAASPAWLKSPGAAACSGAGRGCCRQSQPVLAPEVLQEQLPSPGDPGGLRAGASPLAALLPSPQLPPHDVGAGSAVPPSMQPPAGRRKPGQVARKLSRELQAAERSAGDVEATSPAQDALKGAPEAPVAQDATPVAGSGGGRGSLDGARTDSDTLVARFLSRMPQVTMARGSCLPRWLLSSSSDDSESGSMLRSHDGHGAAERRESSRCSSGGRRSSLSRPPLQCMQIEAQRGQQDAGDEQAKGRGTPEGGSTSSLQQQQQQAGSVGYLHSSPAEGRLPATTRIRMGPPQQRPPAPDTLEGIAEFHFGCAGSPPPPVPFYQSAEALSQEGSHMAFRAGDTSHGVQILYDIKDGQREHALALVQSIYRLGDEAWMEHRYLISRQDLLERPGWAAAAAAMKPGEMLLSVGSYHSPMHLISGEFWLTFPGRAQRVGRGQGQPLATAGQQQQQASARGGVQEPAFTCRRGFDAAAGAVVPLRRALEGFHD